MSKTETINQNSLESPLSLSNGMNREQTIWSRCDSFSSSSCDSAIFPPNGIKRPRFAATKRLANEDRPTNSKRNRNSSGSSASSNLSCVSEREAKDMPVLMSSTSISTINNTNLEALKKLSDISSTSLALQHEVLLSNNLNKSIGVNGVIPFRHNLRRNIRKKKCCCDCNSSCTTVVVSRQYKDVGNRTYEEKTVISRTKVKTFVERNTSQQISENKTSVSGTIFKSSPHKSDTSKKRRSEIEKLYDSLHEIKWAKNFSPDNILRQLDVRQAASCSLFGKSNKSPKPTEKSEKPLNHKFSPDKRTLQSPTKLSKSKFQKPNSNNFCNRRYFTRNSHRLSKNDSLDDANNCPSRFKNNKISNKNSVNCDSKFQSYPLVSGQICTSDNKLNATSTNGFHSIKSENSSESVDIYPKKFLSFELDSGSVGSFENVNDCTFFNMSEEGIHTLDSCFHEVGAEVVVSTCYETDYKLPLLTSAEEIHTENSISNDTPPILEPLLSPETFQPEKLPPNVETDENACFQEVNAEVIVSTCCKANFNLPLLSAVKEFHLEGTSGSNDNPPVLEPLESEHLVDSKPLSNISPDVKSFSDNKEPHQILYEAATLHPPIATPLFQSKSIFQKDFSLLKSCDTENVKFIKCFKENKIEELEIETKYYLNNLDTNEVTSLKKEHFNFDQELSVMESCLEAVEENVSLVNNTNDTVKSEKNKTDVNAKACSVKGKYDSVGNQSILHKSHIVKKHLMKSIAVAAGKKILKKYLKLAHSNLRKINSPNYSENSKKSCCSSTLFSNISNNSKPTASNRNAFARELSIQHENFPPNCTQSLPIKSSIKIDNDIKRDNCVSQTLKTCNQTSKSITNTGGTTVIQSQGFNQKVSITKSPAKVTFNQISQSFFYHSEKDLSKFSSLNRKGRKLSNNSHHNSFQHLDEGPSISGYMKILANSKKKDRSSEKINVPPRVFTCHYQTINVTRGSSYVQIVLKITRGKSIFLTQESLMELKEAINKASHDNDCKLLILNGFGKTFCLGLDLRPIIGSCKNKVVGELSIAIKDLISTLSEFDKPLVAIVNGAAYGLGMTLLNHADVTIATNNASFCMPYSKLGYMPEGAATLTLPQSVGATVAMDLMLRGQVITATQAKNIGLITEVVEIPSLPHELVKHVRTLTDNPLSAMETTKAMFKMNLHLQLPLVLETETRLLPKMWLSSPCQEAIQRALHSGFLSTY